MPDPLNLSDESLPKLAAMLLNDPTLRAPVAQLMANRIEEALTPYFSQPTRFRRALGDARAVLSGSWVLLFTEAHSSTTPPAWTEGDLDVFCPEDGLAIMVASLLEEGYTPANAVQNWDPPSMKSKTGSISRVLKFLHAARERKVDIVCSHAISPFEVVLSFWTTLVMNVVTVHDLTVLYPGLTLSHEGCLPVDHSETNEIGHLADKYIARGYQFHPFPGQRLTDLLPDKPRNTRDEHCLNLPIATPDGYTRAPMGTSVTEWRMDRKEASLRGRALVGAERPNQEGSLAATDGALVGAERPNQEGSLAATDGALVGAERPNQEGSLAATDGALVGAERPNQEGSLAATDGALVGAERPNQEGSLATKDGALAPNLPNKEKSHGGLFEDKPG
ncbi:hypothetical protein K488DRAFT_90546 [Vararia minispora EC-137]|uniref:Uncharacterized protein n=1 Tax=Vararia minispora EC-137 TaxID=1314806 RepID=A0ACB8Q7K7_9AGAM|nr:hypothetical protein K488DRAFT_90546 [Vararia minispora EC-137]